MALTPGTRLGPYEIIGPLGAGGMGEVYRARDSKLGRDVAIKVLPPAFAEDAARMARFEREAQTLAALNHPNIAAIYGVEQGAIVMELVAGEDLKGPVPVETALSYARQIAIALEAAHEKGIIHRDLKPANIKVTPDGVVKLLDFGLAKGEETVPSAAGTSPTMSPTISLPMTQAGMILGTAAYMSPEQARGKTVDKRADIWAFGVVLYELLSGRMLFGGGETVTDSIAAVLTRETDWSALPAETPLRVRRLLDRCLRKDPKVRLRDIGDARFMLDEAEPEPMPPRQRRAWLPWAVAGLALVAGLAGGTAWRRSRTPDTSMGAARFLLILPEGTTETQFSAGPQTVPSPDGRYLAFTAQDASGKGSLWVRPLGSVLARRLDKTEGAGFPFWSPDAQFLAFFADDKLKKIAISGGSPQTLCDAGQSSATIGGGNGGTWNQEGVIVFSPGAGTPLPLMRVPAGGGLPTPVTSLEQAGDRAHYWPQFLPDGRHVLYLALSTDPAKSGIYVQELGSGTRVMVMKSALRAAWAPPGYLLFVREGTLLAQRLDSKTFQLAGEPHSVAQEVYNNEVTGRAAFAVSPNGVLVYRGGLFSRIKQLAWFDREGKRLSVLGQPGEYWSMSLSPDERNAVVLAGRFGRSDLWMMDLTGGVFRRMTREQNVALNIGPWSPDSQRIAVNLVRGGIQGGIQELEVASGKTTALTPGTFTAADWRPDGRSLLCFEKGRSRLSLLSLGSATTPQILQDFPYLTSGFRFSPNGQFVAYASWESGTEEVFVASVPSFGVKRQISSGGGRVPLWRKDGKELFFRGPPGTLMSAQIRTGPKIESTVPSRLFPYGDNFSFGNEFGVTADGKRFLMLEPVQKPGQSAETTVVLNWTAELKQP